MHSGKSVTFKNDATNDWPATLSSTRSFLQHGQRGTLGWSPKEKRDEIRLIIKFKQHWVFLQIQTIVWILWSLTHFIALVSSITPVNIRKL